MGVALMLGLAGRVLDWETIVVSIISSCLPTSSTASLLAWTTGSIISGVSDSVYLLDCRTSFLRLLRGRNASGEGDMSSSRPSNSWL